MTQIANTNVYKVKLMLGHTLDWWNTIMIVFLGVGAIAAVIVVVATVVIVKLEKQSSAAADAALEQFKISARLQIAQATAISDSARAEAAEANNRAAFLENQTAQAKLDLQKFSCQGL